MAASHFEDAAILFAEFQNAENDRDPFCGTGSANPSAMAAQLLPEAEIHWSGPCGYPLSLYGCTGKLRLWTSHDPSASWVRSRKSTPRW